MRGHLLLYRPIFLIVLVVLGLRASEGGAANKFAFKWHTYNHPNSCRGTGLLTEGQDNFSVNEFPIPTYTVAGSLSSGPQGSFNQDFQAPFSGTLFRVGRNDIEFHYEVVGLPSCVESDETVRLQGPGTDRLLFQVKNAGSQVSGATDIELSLREIDPNLADALENLKRSIREATQQARNDAAEADQTGARFDELQAAIDQLLDRGFDEISPEDLDALLSQYDDLLDNVRDALVAYLSDLQSDITELRGEITRIAGVFSERLHNVEGIGDGAPGFDPQDPGGFTPIATGDPPPISIPDVLGDDPWSDAHDPYAKYADEVLATLQPTVENGAVVQRATFLEIHGAWIYNMEALENILQQRARVSVREWGAFLNAKGRVLSFFEPFVDHDGWMRDAPVTPQLRAMIAFLKDLDAAYRFKQRAEALQLAINLWNRDALTERQNTLLDILVLFDEAMRARMAQGAPQEREDGFWNKMEGIADAAIAFADVAVSFTPVGHLLDLCRAIGGRSQCITGEQLSTAERITYGAASVIGGGAVWKAAAAKLGGPAAGVVRGIGDALENLVKRRPKKGIFMVIDHPGGAKTYFHESGASIRYSREGFADFRPYMYKGTAGKAEVKIRLRGNRAADEAAANAEAGFTNGKPENFTWHHDEEVGTMILVDSQVHRDFAHTGGFALFKKIQELLGL